MRKLFLLFTVLLFTVSINAQVGINTTDPKATLDVVGEPGTLDGVIPPRITADELSTKTYDATNHPGTIVYVTTDPSNDFNASNTQTSYVKEPGIYYFDGQIWERFISSNNKKGRCIKTPSNGPFPVGSNGTELRVGNYTFRWNNLTSALLSTNNQIEVYKNTTGSTRGYTNQIGGTNIDRSGYEDINFQTWTQITDGIEVPAEQASTVLFVTTQPEVYSITLLGGRDGTQESYLCLNIEQLF